MNRSRTTEDPGLIMNRCGKPWCNCNPILGAILLDGRRVCLVYRDGGFVVDRPGTNETQWYPNNRFQFVDEEARIVEAEGSA